MAYDYSNDFSLEECRRHGIREPDEIALWMGVSVNHSDQELEVRMGPHLYLMQLADAFDRADRIELSGMGAVVQMTDELAREISAKLREVAAAIQTEVMAGVDRAYAGK